jgi:hypothetical protein
LNSRAICWFEATISLKVSAILPASPVQVPGSRTEKSPSRMLCRLVRIIPSSAGAGSIAVAVAAAAGSLPESPFAGSRLGSPRIGATRAFRSILFMNFSPRLDQKGRKACLTTTGEQWR